MITNFIKNNKNKTYLVIISLLLIFHFISTIVWLNIDSNSPTWDESYHLQNILRYKNYTDNFIHDVSLKNIKQIINKYHYYPPFYYYMALPLLYVFGSISDIFIALINFIFVGILFFSTYGIGKNLWNKEVGLLSTIFISISPVFMSFYKQALLDLPVTAMVTLSIYLLIKNRKLNNYKYSILLAIAISCGMLIKWTYVFFLLFPIIYILFINIYKQIKNKSYNIIQYLNTAILLIIPFLLLCGWYLNNFLKIIENASTKDPIKSNPNPLSVKSFLWYLEAILNWYTFLALFLLFIVGIAFILIKKKAFKNNLIILISIFTSYIVLSLIENKDIRYIAPIIPLIAIISAYWIYFLKIKRLYIYSIAGFVFFIYFIGINYFNVFENNIILRPKHFKFPITIFAHGGYMANHPFKSSWQLESILNDIVENSNSEESVLNMYYKNNPRFNKENFKLNISKEKLHINIRYPYIKNDTLMSDYAIFKINNYKNKIKINKIKTTPYKNSKIINKSEFEIEEINTYLLPKNSIAILYKINNIPDLKISIVDMPSETGELIKKDGQMIRKTLSAKHKPGYMIYGPYWNLPRGEYTLTASIKTPNIKHKKGIGRLEIHRNNKIIKKIIIKNTKDKYKIFKVNFKSISAKETFEFKLNYFGKCDLELNNLVLSSNND